MYACYPRRITLSTEYNKARIVLQTFCLLTIGNFTLYAFVPSHPVTYFLPMVRHKFFSLPTNLTLFLASSFVYAQITVQLLAHFPVLFCIIFAKNLFSNLICCFMPKFIARPSDNVDPGQKVSVSHCQKRTVNGCQEPYIGHIYTIVYDLKSIILHRLKSFSLCVT